MSQLISMVDQLKITATIYKRHIRQVDDYLKFNRCPKNIKQAVKEFYDFHYRQRIFDEERIFSELNPILLDEITTCGIIEYIEVEFNLNNFSKVSTKIPICDQNLDYQTKFIFDHYFDF